MSSGVGAEWKARCDERGIELREGSDLFVTGTFLFFEVVDDILIFSFFFRRHPSRVDQLSSPCVLALSRFGAALSFFAPR